MIRFPCDGLPRSPGCSPQTNAWSHPDTDRARRCPSMRGRLRSPGLVAPLLLAGLPSCAPACGRSRSRRLLRRCYSGRAYCQSCQRYPLLHFRHCASTSRPHGGRTALSVWIGPKVAVDLGLGYSSSGIFSQSSNSACFDTPAGVQSCSKHSTGSTDNPAFVWPGAPEALVMLANRPRCGPRVATYLAAGLGFVARGLDRALTRSTAWGFRVPTWGGPDFEGGPFASR